MWGSGGKAPGSTGAGLKVLLGVGKAHGFVLVVKRKLPPCGRHLPLNSLCGNISVKGRSAIPPPSGVSICSLFPLTIFDFFRDRKTEGKPGLLTCPNGQVKSPNPPERKEKKKKITRIQYLCGFPGFLDVVIRHS